MITTSFYLLLLILAYTQQTASTRILGLKFPKTCTEKKPGYFPATKEQANCEEGWRRVEGRCLQQSGATREFCSVAWQQVIICQCAVSTCQQPKPTQAASTGKYVRQLLLQASSALSQGKKAEVLWRLAFGWALTITATARSMNHALKPKCPERQKSGRCLKSVIKDQITVILNQPCKTNNSSTPKWLGKLQWRLLRTG